jgi:hypothetical protein
MFSLTMLEWDTVSSLSSNLAIVPRLALRHNF